MPVRLNGSNKFRAALDALEKITTSVIDRAMLQKLLASTAATPSA